MKGLETIVALEKSFHGGPSCIFRGVSVPALIACSPKGSITSEILTAAFRRLDNLNMYRRTPTLNPFALFDAHDSRLQVPFLRYINTPASRWVFCIGLPNGTHIHQSRMEVINVSGTERRIY